MTKANAGTSCHASASRWILVVSILAAFATPLLGRSAETLVADNSGSILSAAASVSGTAADSGALTMQPYATAFARRDTTTEAIVGSASNSPFVAVAQTDYYPLSRADRSLDWRTVEILRADRASVGLGAVALMAEPSSWFAALLTGGVALVVARQRAARRSPVRVENT